MGCMLVWRDSSVVLSQGPGWIMWLLEGVAWRQAQQNTYMVDSDRGRGGEDTLAK